MSTRTMSWSLLLVLLMIGSWLGVPASPAQAAPQTEQEPNDTRASAQPLAAIGWESPLSGSINVGRDRDFYSFSAEAGRTYVVELFNVSTPLAIGGGACSMTGSEGLALFIYGAAEPAVAGQCSASGSGNVHTDARFTAGSSGPYLIQVFSSSVDATGSYSLRVLPQYDEPGASWDAATFEPNNWRNTAYALSVGREAPLTASIEARDSRYATNAPDEDWYRFETVAGRTYVVELFNVSTSLAVGGGACSMTGGEGMALFVYGAAAQSIAGQCSASGSGNIHTDARFTAGSSGTFFVKVFPNNPNGTGSYSLRVLPQYDEPGASWDAVTFEPNNWRNTAYALSAGRETPLTASIEARDSRYATNAPDEDWYRFEAVAGRSYAVELFNVSTTMTAGGGACSMTGGEGMALFVYGAAERSVAGQCSAQGAGNVHALARFTAGSSGSFFVKVFPNNPNATGSYSLRVLLRYDEPGASWDSATFEPNNSFVTAYSLGDNAVMRLNNASIESRERSFSTFIADRDWYHFPVVGGGSYTIELFDVSAPLNVGGGACSGFGATGLAMALYDTNIAEVAKSCPARDGSGRIHSRLSFTAGSSGTFYAEIFPNSHNATGSYSVRVCAGMCPPLEDTPAPQPNFRVYLPAVKR